MLELKCSFCRLLLPQDDLVAGPEVYICSTCAIFCVEVFAKRSPSWRDSQLTLLLRLREGSKSDPTR